MIIKRTKDSRLNRAITQKIADIPGGVTLSPGDFSQAVVKEGTPIGKDGNGLYHVVKQAILTAELTDTGKALSVAKGHDFKVGDFIMLKEGSTAYAIASITTSDSAKDVLNIGTTLGVAAVAGDFVLQAKAESAATTSAFKYAPFAIIGESYDVVASENLHVNAWIIAVLYGAQAPLAPAVKTILNGIFSI